MCKDLVVCPRKEFIDFRSDVRLCYPKGIKLYRPPLSRVEEYRRSKFDTSFVTPTKMISIQLYSIIFVVTVAPFCLKYTQISQVKIQTTLSDLKLQRSKVRVLSHDTPMLMSKTLAA